MTGRHSRPVNQRRRALVVAAVTLAFAAGMSLSLPVLPPYESARRVPDAPYVPQWQPDLVVGPAPDEGAPPPVGRVVERVQTVRGPSVVPVAVTSPARSPGRGQGAVLPQSPPAPLPSVTPLVEPTPAVEPSVEPTHRDCPHAPHPPPCGHKPKPSPS